MGFIAKVLISGVIIAFASWLANRNTTLAGFIIALPLMSILSIFFLWNSSHDMQKVNEFAVSIVTAVPLSLVFFAPFILNRWLKMNFALTFGLAFVLLAAGYAIHQIVLKTIKAA